MPSKAQTPLSIVVVGGGVGGLAASILLAQDGHQVVVIEQRDESFASRSMGGLSLVTNSVRWIQAMGLEQEFSQLADTGHQTLHIKYDTGKPLRALNRALLFSMVHRADVLKMFLKQAVETGVKLRFGTSVSSIVDSTDQPTVTLVDGTELSCDLVVGADGIDSVVRRTVFPDVSPKLTPYAVMLVNIPRSVMEQSPEASKLYHTQPFHSIMSPGRHIVSWAMTKREMYHLQMCDFEYGNGEPYAIDDSPEGPYITTMTDCSGFKKRWSDHDASIQHVVDSTTSYTKWKIAELPPLDTYCSKTGHIVLLGDSCHAIQPFAGQGANMAIEDGKALSTLLSLISTKDEIPEAMHVYDTIRIPRLAGIRQIIDTNVKAFSLNNAEAERIRDEKLIGASTKVENEQQDVTIEQARQKDYGAAERYKWMEAYNAETEAIKAWNSSRSKEGHETSQSTAGSHL